MPAVPDEMKLGPQAHVVDGPAEEKEPMGQLWHAMLEPGERKKFAGHEQAVGATADRAV